MNLKKVGKMGIAGLISVLFIPVIAGAFGPGNGFGGKGFGRGGNHRSYLGIWRNPQIQEELNLTKEQVQKIRDAYFTSQEKRNTLRAQIDGLSMKLDRAFTEGIIKDKEVLSLAQKISDVKGKLMILSVESRLAITKILTAEQLEKLNYYKMQRRGNGRHYGRRQMYRSKPMTGNHPYDRTIHPNWMNN